MSEAPETVAPRMPSAPRRPLPAGACDTHTHVFGPFVRFPVPATGSYAPPVAPPPVHQAMMDLAGLGRAVLIQPAPYGTDNSALVSALRERPGTLRGVAVIRAGASDAEFEALREAGVTGLRFNEMRDPRGGGRYKGSVGVEDYLALAPRMRAFGLVPHVWAGWRELPDILDAMLEPGLPVVVDHLAGVNLETTLDGRAFRTFLRHLSDGDIWAKLSLCRTTFDDPSFAAQRPFHDAIVAANPERVLWASDWPFVRMYEKSPDVGRLLDILDDWIGDDKLRETILVDNPVKLYGFSASGNAGTR